MSACTTTARRARGICLLTVLALSVSRVGHGGDVTRLGPAAPYGRRLGHLYSLEGPIRKGDTERLARLFEADVADPASAVTALAHARGVLPPLILQLDSSSGDLLEAMRLGRWLRRAHGGVAVAEGDACVSACILVLAGGVMRSTPGRVIVHDPSSAVPRAAHGVSDKTRRAIRAYLSEMTVPLELADLVAPAAPGDEHVLTLAEKRHLGLQGIDPAADNERITVLARAYRVAPDVLRERFAAAERQCGSVELLQRRSFTLKLSGHSGIGEELEARWSDCYWGAVGPLPSR